MIKRRTFPLNSDFDQYQPSRNNQQEKDGSRKRDSTRRLLLGLDCHHTDSILTNKLHLYSLSHYSIDFPQNYISFHISDEIDSFEKPPCLFIRPNLKSSISLVFAFL